MSDDEKPVSAMRAGSSKLNACGDTPPNAGVSASSPNSSPSKKWKRNVLSPLKRKSSSTKPSEHADDLPNSKRAKSALRAEKRITARDVLRATNDIKKCFEERAAKATAAATERVQKGTSSSSSTISGRLDEAFLLSRKR